MADFPLVLEGPGPAWAEQVRATIQQAMGGRGSVHIELPDDPPTGSAAQPDLRITGIATCDEPADEMLDVIERALVDYAVETRDLETGPTEVIVRPRN